MSKEKEYGSIPGYVMEVRTLKAKVTELEDGITRVNNICVKKTRGLQAKLKTAVEENEELSELLNSRCVPVMTPPIVCLCGSTRFMEAFFDAGWKFTLEGRVVLSVGVCKHAEDHGGEALEQDVADALDELHLRKIDLADEVFVLNVGGYIGESTAKEIAYALSTEKPVKYLEVIPESDHDLNSFPY